MRTITLGHIRYTAKDLPNHCCPRIDQQTAESYSVIQNCPCFDAPSDNINDIMNRPIVDDVHISKLALAQLGTMSSSYYLARELDIIDE
jgi:hypothetical protein